MFSSPPVSQNRAGDVQSAQPCKSQLDNFTSTLKDSMATSVNPEGESSHGGNCSKAQAGGCLPYTLPGAHRVYS